MKRKGLSKAELEDWFQTNSVIEVSDVFGVIDMRRRAALEAKMSEKQKDILSDAIEAIEDHNVKPAIAYRKAYERMGGNVRSRRKLKKVI
jgi:hypothetical protein